jgi:hypothetical protein
MYLALQEQHRAEQQEQQPVQEQVLKLEVVSIKYNSINS